MSLEEFIQFNTDVSSEMFVSVMAIFHERLPCSQFYFRQRRKFKNRYHSRMNDSFDDSGKTESFRSSGVWEEKSS